MGNCTYCGKPAGFLRSKHAECEQQHIQRQRIIEEGKKRIALEVVDAIKGTGSFDELEKSITEIEKSCSVPSSDRKGLLIEGWETSVNRFLDDSILDEREERRLAEFTERFALPVKDLDKNGALTKTTKAAVLRRVLNGVLPPPSLSANVNETLTRQ